MIILRRTRDHAGSIVTAMDDRGRWATFVYDTSDVLLAEYPHDGEDSAGRSHDVILDLRRIRAGLPVGPRTKGDP